MSTKFGLLIDFDLLKAVSSTSTKPEVFSGRGAILRNGYDVIFSQKMVRYGRNSVAWCRITRGLREVIEIETGSRIPICERLFFFKNGSCYISAVNRDMSTKFGLLIDFDLLKAVSWTKQNRK